MKEGHENYFIKVHTPLFLVQVCFAALPVFSKIAFKAFGPGLLAFFRISGMALLLSFIFFFFQREKIKEPKHLLYMALLAFFGAAGNIYFYLRGLELSTAINATILISSVPVFTFIVALVLRQEEFSLGKMIGIIIAFSGVGILINLSNFKMGGFLAGNLFILLNSFLYSIYLVLIKSLLKIYKPFTILTYVFIFATIELLPFTIADIMKFNPAAVQSESLFPLVMVLTVGTFFPYLFNSLALKHAPSSFVAIYVYLQPVLAAVMAALMLGEVITLRMAVSAVMIIIGVTIVRFPKILLFYKHNKDRT